MKLPFKHIAILVILSLTGIFAYQTYWLIGLYISMKDEMQKNIVETMRISDYNEMMLRIKQLQADNNNHSEITVSANYNAHGQTLERKTTSRVIDTLSDKSIKTKIETQYDTLDSKENDNEAMLRSTNGLDVLLKKQQNMMELAKYFQRGIHSGLDAYIEIDLQCYDSLFTQALAEKNIHIPHRILLIHTTKYTNRDQFCDTLSIVGDSAYIPNEKALRYEYIFDMHGNWKYQLIIEPYNMLVVKQMSGILTTSFIILIILSFSFWYLIRTLLRQKTLEEMKTDFTNNITHELKTPIAVAYAANDALLNFNQAKEKEKRNQYLRITQEQLQLLSGLVEQILSMSMEQRKTFRLHPEEIELQQLIGPLIKLHQLKTNKTVHIELEIVPKSLKVITDRTHLNNILSNLIDNAIKYSPGQADIKIHAYEIGEKTEISVTDHGIGIAADKQKEIFNKFYRVPTGNLHEVKGFGLGLYYVKTMVEKLGGTISVKSKPGQGSTFTIQL